MSKLLTAEELAQAHADTPGWTLAAAEISRTFTLPSFAAALVFSAAVGHLAERADHHPDILIQYRNVTLRLATHSAGGLTAADFALAAEIDAIERPQPQQQDR